MDAVSGAVELLGQRYGHDDGAFEVAERHHRILFADEADDREIGTADFDRFAGRIGRTRKEVFLHLRADDADLAATGHIHLVDVTAVRDFLRLDALVVGRITHDGIIALALFVTAMLLVAPEDGRGVEHFGKLPHGVDVAVVHTPPSVFRHALVGDAGLLGLHQNGIGRHVAQLSAEHAREPHTGTEHHREHEDAPKDAQCRHDTPLAVAGDGLPDFVPAVYVEKMHHRLFVVAQGVDGFELRGAVGRNVAGDQTGGDQHDGRTHDDTQVERRIEENRGAIAFVACGSLREDVVDDLHHGDAQHHAEVAECRRDADRFGQNQPDDRRGLGAEGLADAELGRALRDRHQHDVADADDAGQQRAEADDPYEEVDAPKDHLKGFVAFHRVVDPDGAFVLGVEFVLDSQPAAQPFFESFEVVGRFHAIDRQHDVVDLGIVLLVEQLGRRERDETRRIVALGVAFLHADDRKFRIADLDLSAQRRCALEKEPVHHLVDDDDLAVVAQVVVVDEPSGRELDALHALRGRHHAADPHRGELVAASRFLAAVPCLRHDFVDFGKFTLENCDVAVSQFDASVFLISGVRLRRAAAVEVDRVGGIVAEVGRDTVFEPVAGAQQND